MSIRNRSEGWQHAKLSGHQNEVLVDELFSEESAFLNEFLHRLGKQDLKIASHILGGLHEKNVASVLGDSTKSKTDLKIIFEDKSKINISIKKSLNGQVFLIGVDRFIAGYELQFGNAIPPDVATAMRLFWGTHKDTVDIINNIGENKRYELRKNRLVASTLKSYNTQLYELLLKWFAENITDIFVFCFASGLAAAEEECADAIWYINKLGENDVDDLFLINELKEKISIDIHSTVFYGTAGGGTTIQLPFGFVQWHQGKMQFHHSYKKLTER